MINAREEFENAIKGVYIADSDSSVVYDVLCAWVCFVVNSKVDMDQAIYLMKGHTPQEYEEFLTKIDREYDDGFGSQKLMGMIWLTNGDWFQRHEYDGSEYWEHMTRPEILEGCEGPPVVKSYSKE